MYIIIIAILNAENGFELNHEVIEKAYNEATKNGNYFFINMEINSI
jgi:hypothetical protein